MLKIDVISGLKDEEYRHILNLKIKLTDTTIESVLPNPPDQYTRIIEGIS